MEGCKRRDVRRLRSLTTVEIRRALLADSEDLTKSLLNLLYNLFIVQSVPVPSFEPFVFFTTPIKELLNDSTSLTDKRHLLADNPVLAKLIAQACP